MDVLARETLFGRATKLRGELVGTENVVIEGEFEGILRLEGARLTVGPEARVRAGILAHEVVVYGRVEGEIHATGYASLRAQASVVGDVFAARLSMEEGTTLSGHVDPARAAEPLPRVALNWSTGAVTESTLTLTPPEVRGGAAPVQRPALDMFGTAESSASHRAGLAAATRQLNGAAEHDSDMSEPTELTETQA